MDSKHQIDCISGACFLIKKDIFQKMGSWDETYFIYGEDIDLSYQLKKNGYKLLYYPKAEITHYKKRSGRRKKLNKDSDHKTKANSKEHFYYTMKLFYQKNYQNKYPKLVYKLVLFGIKVISLIRS